MTELKLKKKKVFFEKHWKKFFSSPQGNKSSLVMAPKILTIGTNSVVYAGNLALRGLYQP